MNKKIVKYFTKNCRNCAFNHKNKCNVYFKDKKEVEGHGPEPFPLIKRCAEYMTVDQLAAYTYDVIWGNKEDASIFFQ